jgi:hypothetical protein
MFNVIQDILPNEKYYGKFDKARMQQIQMAWKNKECRSHMLSNVIQDILQNENYYGKFDEARTQQIQMAWKNKECPICSMSYKTFCRMNITMASLTRCKCNKYKWLGRTESSKYTRHLARHFAKCKLSR